MPFRMLPGIGQVRVFAVALVGVRTRRVLYSGYSDVALAEAWTRESESVHGWGDTQNQAIAMAEQKADELRTKWEHNERKKTES